MRKRVFIAALLPIVALLSQAAAGLAEEVPETVVFDLHYHGLTSPNDSLSYRSYWGFGSSPPTDNPFVEAVKKQVPECDLVYNASLKQAQWSVVELKNKKPVALYFDLNGDGKLADNERIPPTTTSREQSGGYEFTFITPDFTIRQDNGREVPFRVMVVADGGDEYNYMWSPCCILEGQATFAGESMRLLLYGNGFSGSFDTFGRCSFAIVPTQQQLPQYLGRDTLSSLICHDGVFYQLSFAGSNEEGKTLQVKLQKDTSPTGRATVNLKGKEPLRTRCQSTTITGASDDTIRFRTKSFGSLLPIGQYTLSSAYTLYGVESDDEWRVNFSNGPNFTIAKDETARIDLGELSLNISAIDQQDRYRNNPKEKSTYAKGTTIYLAPQIKGKAGETYMRFSRKNAGGNQWTDIKPHVTILDADNHEVASADMEYG